MRESTDGAGGVLPIIRSVRRRWRLRVSLGGASIVLVVGLAAFVLSAWSLELLRFSPAAVVTLRVLAWAVVVGLAAFFLVRPLMRRVSDEQVALYLEEHEPSLEAAILGAVEAERLTKRAPGLSVAGPSPVYVRRLVEQAVERARAVEYGKRIEQRMLYRSSGILGVVAFASLAFLLLAPAGVRHGMSALLFPMSDAAAASPYAVSVAPGDVTIARGSDQFVSASLSGFISDDVSLFTRSQEGEPYQRLSMIPTEDGTGFELLLLNLQEETSYFVESNGVRSPTFTIKVADLPYVDRIAQEYRFPSYTGLESRLVEDGGDIAALQGTVVRMTIHPTMAAPAGDLVLDDATRIPLTPGADGVLTGELTVTGRGVYRVELEAPDGTLVNASPTFTIDVLTDQTPTVRFDKPGRDAPASPIEEVYLEARADDDYGIREVLLAYSVNGQPEDTISLYQGGGGALTEVTAGHTLFLEEFGLEPGDVITYYGVVKDNNGAGNKEVLSDLYFLHVRPFGREYRQAEQMGGGGGMGGGQAGAEAALSELQRQVIAATFNLSRDRATYDEQTFRENTTSVALAQGRVRTQVETLTERMVNRGIANAEESFREIAELLPQAIADMEKAESLLQEGKTQEAITPEQLALRVLLKAEETYERWGGRRGGGGGGGGGGQAANAEDLADLFELELDKLRNQYETVERGERQQADNEVDELLEKLKELATRQQQEAERQRRRAAAQQGSASGGSSSDGQRELAEQTEETARQLERLSRETGDQQLEETARRLQEAADAMRRSAAGSGNGRLADASSALDNLEEAQRRLERAREERGTASTDEALERARQLAEDQRQVQSEVDRLSDDPARRREQVQRIVDRKEDMYRETQELEQQLDRLSGDVRRDAPEVARELSEAADQIRESKLKEKIAFSRGVVREREEEFVQQFEDQIAGDLAELERRVAEASEATADRGGERELEETLDRAQDLVRGMESLGRRMAERGEPGEPGQGQQGEPSDQPSDGQRRLEPGDQQPSDQGGAQGGDQGGSQGSDAQGGAQGGPGGNYGSNMPNGGSNWAGGGVRGNPRSFSPDEIRQYQREFAERLRDATELRREMQERGQEVQDLDEAIAALRDLQNVQTYRDLPQIALLQQTVQDNLKRVEFSIRREVEGDEVDRVFLSGTDAVPTGFRRLVEEYYRALARGGSGQ